MKVVAVYNMKGGVGKTTMAVNLSYLAAASGQRALLWDLDPQAASSFAFRVRPRVEGFSRKTFESGHMLAEAIKATDYHNLDLLPADFAYRKLDRLLDRIGKPERVMPALLATIGRDYDTVFLDCPAGFSLLTEGIFLAADTVLVPAIPTVLSLRMVARLMKWADRSATPSDLSVYFSMVDRRKMLHRRACEWSRAHPGVFLTAQIPYASVVEQMAVRRMPLPLFAARDAATIAFRAIWTELQARLQRRAANSPPRDRWTRMLRAAESLIARLEATDWQQPWDPSRAPSVRDGDSRSTSSHDGVARATSTRVDRGPKAGAARGQDSPAAEGVHFVHSFDTDARDLQRCGYLLELRERSGTLQIVAARSGSDEDQTDTTSRTQAQIDGRWATEILSGAMSPLTALEHRLGRSALIEALDAVIAGRPLRRFESRVMGGTSSPLRLCAHP